MTNRARYVGTSVRPIVGSGRYEIRVRGHLADRWTAWFDGMTLTTAKDGTTVLRGAVADQSALYGLLKTLSDLGLPLVSVIPIAPEPATPPDHS